MKRNKPAGGLDKVRLATLLGLVFVAITGLTAALIYYAHGQLKWQAFHQYRGFATSVSNAIEAGLSEAISTELQRPASQYEFYDTSLGSGYRSELALLGYRGEFIANLGYFQVDSSGQFSSPLLPQPGSETTSAGLLPSEWSVRRSRANDLASILGNSSLVSILSREDSAALSASAIQPATQAKRKQVATTAAAPSSTVAELKFDSQLSKKSTSYERRQSDRQLVRSEREAADGSGLVFEADTLNESASEPAMLQSPAVEPEEEGFPRVTAFNSTPVPFEFSVLGSGHFVLFRRVTVDNEALVQGMVLQKNRFLDTQVGSQFDSSPLSQWGRLVVALEQTVVADFTGQTRPDRNNAAQSTDDLLYQRQLSAPFGSLRLVYSLERLPVGPAGGVLLWVSIALASVLCGGFYILYRAGLKQIELSQQQQNFVASVTHELKTPLTSIRMYGEMLQSGWVSDDKRQEYYQYIHDESQRLSRLIANVLQLANLSHESILPELETVSSVELMTGIKSALQTHLQHSKVTVEYSLDVAAETLQVRLDKDAWAQVVINLVDNAIKFSSRPDALEPDASSGDQCRLSISIAQKKENGLTVDFRDYGPGIPEDQRKKIFDLFYRPENELVRQTAGTGIGLAIVRQLLNQMQAGIDVVNANPGARFRVTFPLAPK